MTDCPLITGEGPPNAMPEAQHEASDEKRKDCYVTEMDFQPALEGVVGSMTAWVDKSTKFPVKGQTIGTITGLLHSTVVDFSYVFANNEWWPIEVGKGIRVSETMDMTTKAPDSE